MRLVTAEANCYAQAVRDVDPVIAESDSAAERESLLQRRDTHIDPLLERLKEPRVCKVIEPVLCGGAYEVDPLAGDAYLCFDFVLLIVDKHWGLRPPNPIYRDITVRVLNR
jgi:hypothetical protein